jgi:predicted transcriptional regulator
MAPSDGGSEVDVEAVADALRKRAPVLELLADGPRDQRDIRDELGVSRSTVYKSLQDLSSLDLVVERDGAYALTGFGRLAWRRHDEYVARLRRLAAGRRLIETLPDDRRFPQTLFERGRIAVPGRHAPERPLDLLSDLGSYADHLRVVSPSGMPRFMPDLHDNATTGEQTATIVVEADAVPRLRSGYERFEEAVAIEGLQLRRIDEQLPYALVVFDREAVGLFGYEEGVLVGASFSADDDALSWAVGVFERALERSAPIDAPEPEGFRRSGGE